MPFVKRQANGEILAVYAQAAQVDQGAQIARVTDDGLEEVATDDPGLKEFLAQQAGLAAPGEGTMNDLMDSDAGMVRVLEDLINLLIDKGSIAVTDLPEAAQQKLLARGSLRHRFGYLETLLSGDGDEEVSFAPSDKDFM
jgi:hypothetical protein